jgi:hypothetical protein
MTTRNRRGAVPDVDTLIALNCEPDIEAERQAEARALLHEAFGPYAESMLRACGQAAAAQRETRTLREQLERMTAGTQLRGIVTGVQNGRVRVQLGGNERVFARPPELMLGIGQIVYTDASAQAVLGAGDYLVGGVTYAYCDRLEGRHVLVRPLRDGAQEEEVRQLAVVADCVDLEGLAPGDRVLGYGGLELGNVVLITRWLGPARTSVPEDVGAVRVVRREDIVGLDEIVDQLECLFLEAPSPAYAALLSQIERAQVGVVLSGRPGSGKSLVADYIVERVRARGGLALVRTASSYLPKWVGEGARRLREDFAALDTAYAASGVRPLLVIDELEGIALDRSQGFMLQGGHLDVLDTLLALLTRSKARMIGISNLADRYIDTALTRDGRLPVLQLPSTLDPEQVASLVAKSLTGVRLAAPGGDA